MRSGGWVVWMGGVVGGRMEEMLEKGWVSSVLESE